MDETGNNLEGVPEPTYEEMEQAKRFVTALACVYQLSRVALGIAISPAELMRVTLMADTVDPSEWPCGESQHERGTHATGALLEKIEDFQQVIKDMKAK